MSKAYVSIREAMTAEEIASAQNEHYMLDDQIRRMTGKLTADQKRKMIDSMRSMCGQAEDTQS